MNSTSKTILAVMGAAAVGAVIGLLIAPEKGSDLRRRIQDRTEDWTHQLQDLLAQGREQLNTLKNKAASQTSSSSTSTYASGTEGSLTDVRERM